MPARALITGVNGFVGSHLADFLIAKGVEVVGMRRSWRSPMDNLRHLPEGAISYVDADLTDANAVRWALEGLRGDLDYVFHLGAQSYVVASVGGAHATLNVNILGTLNLLQALADTGCSTPTIHICSSSEVYGQPLPNEVPIRETQELRPISPYGASKAGMDRLAHALAVQDGTQLFITRAFTHSGSRRGAVFFDSAFCRQIARMEQGLQPPTLKVGNLSSVRTVMDVRDLVRGYWELARHNRSSGFTGEVYNIGGNETFRVCEVVEKLRAMTNVPFTAAVDQDLLRPADVTNQIPDLARIRAAIGWEPAISYQETLRSMLDYWRAETRRQREC